MCTEECGVEDTEEVEVVGHNTLVEVLNKFLVDDKGLLLLLVFGLPPLVHTDDPLRAVLACIDMVDVIKGPSAGPEGDGASLLPEGRVLSHACSVRPLTPLSGGGQSLREESREMGSARRER